MTESSPAAPDARQFRNAMGLFATGVTVIAARIDDHAGGDEVVAMTVNAVTSVSLDPMLVLFCPNKKSRFAAHLAELTGFTVNVLREDQEALSTYFAGGWKDPTPPPFRFVPAQCAPRLEGSLAALHCDKHSIVDAGDHWIVIGRVAELHVGLPPHRPLLFFGGQYRHLNVADRAPAPDLVDVHDEPAHIFYEHW